MGLTDSSLHQFAKQGQHRYLTQSLKNKSKRRDINEVLDNATPLFCAVTEQKTKAVAVLLQHAANPNILCHKTLFQGQKFEWSALHEACRHGNMEILQYLLAHQADANLQAHHQMTPLHIAAWHGHQDIIRALLSADCDVNLLDRFKESALIIPICHGDYTTVDLLLTSGCRLNSRSWGNLRKIRGKFEMDFRETLYTRHGPLTLFSLSVLYAWLDIARLLLQHGFNSNKYLIHDILIDLKATFGTISADGEKLIRCFVASGYRSRRNDEDHLNNLEAEQPSVYHSELVSWVKDLVLPVASLKDLCRTVIRIRVRVATRQASVIPSVQKLPLPQVLKDFISLKEFSDHPEGFADGEESNRNEYKVPLYFSMPRQPQQCRNRHVYTQFWMASCCCRK